MDMNPIEAMIWADLLVKGTAAAETVRSRWPRYQYVNNFALSWVSEPILGEDGSVLTDVVSVDLPSAVNREELKELVVATKSTAMLVGRLHANGYSLLLETPWGSCSWSLLKERKGDLTTLSTPLVKKPAEEELLLHLLWRPRS